ncbi:MAG TPA: hypothetical protein VFY73_01380 [Ideonella sp.]|uniref:hypothetical protein n=1 Tax=Ideonella sp. TaxID=1929293 RepID=UPI002E30DE31|nr:hypothetical protein [Ideonella sp.]HEX5682659.1 hypothetical protein [Ideonella sp.]
MATAPAAEASTSFAASAPVLFKSDETEVDFPWAGACLLVLLAVVAVLVRRRAAGGHRQRGPKWLQRWAAASGAGQPPEPRAALTMQSSIRLNAQTQLHAVKWRDRHFLIATSSNAGPVLLHSESPTVNPSEASS